MSKKFLTSIDLHKNELQNAVVHSLATAPDNGTAGQIYYNSTDKKLYQYTGSAWECVGVNYALAAGTLSNNSIPITLSANGTIQDTINIAGSGGATLSFSNGTLTITTADNNTTYTFTGAASGTAYVITCTPSSGSAQTITIPLADGTNAGLMSPSEYTKLSGIESGAEANVQSDWSQSDSTADDFIKNKPTTGTASDLSTGTSTTAKVWTPKVIHDYVAGVSPVQTNTNTTPYQFRPTPQCGSIEYLDQVVGGTLAVNQLVQTTDTEVTITSGHKYLSKINDVQTVAQSDGTAIAINDGTKDNVFDLTRMFGSTIADYVYNLEQSTAGSGVAWLKQYFPRIFNSYQPYNAGELMSVEASEHRMTGFNQFDKTATSYVSGNYRYFDIPIGATQELYISFTDKDTSVDVSDVNVGFTIVNASIVPSYIWNMTAGVIKPNHSNITNAGDTELRGLYCPYLIIYPNTQDVLNRLLARYDICVNISSLRNGEYEAYTQTSYPLDSDLILRGIPKILNGVPYYDGDEYKSDGSVSRRYGVVDMGDLSWTYFQDGIFYANYSAKAYGLVNMICSKYQTSASASVDDKKIYGRTDSSRFYVKDTAYSDAATFRAAVTGQTICFELATPTTETADPFTNPQVCYKGGTEEFIADNVVPVGQTTYYPLTLKDTMPTSNGTYTLSLTVADGKPTLSWS